MVIFPPVFFAGAFFGEWIFWESRLRWVHVLVIAKYCDDGFKRSGILDRDRPKKTKSTIFHNVSLDVSKTLLLNLVFLGKNVSFPQNAKNFERLSNTEGRPSFVPESWCYLGQVILWESINRPENHQNYQPTDRDGWSSTYWDFPLNISTLEYDFFKVHFSLTCDSPNTPFCNSLPTKKDIPFHHSSGTRNDRSAQVVVSSKICSCALKPDDRHLLMVSSTRSLGVEVGDKFMTSKVNWLVTNPDLEGFQSVKVVCAS